MTPANNVPQEPSLEGRSWEKKKTERLLSDRGTVNELLRMSHSGYGAPVSTWNGTRTQLDKEVSNERREERKRMMMDNGDQGRIKRPKVCMRDSYKSNPGYNPVQVNGVCVCVFVYRMVGLIEKDELLKI